MNNFKNILISSLVLVLFSCSSKTRVVSFTNDEISFEKYKSYNIVNLKKGDKEFSSEGAIFINKIEKGITTEMDKKQYIKSNDPDIIIRYEIISSVNVRSNNNTPYFNNSVINRNQYDPFYMPYNNSAKQIEGVLLIELKSIKSKKLIWQGSLDMKYSRKSEKNEDLLINAIQTIFNEYKYIAGKSQPQTKEVK